MTAVRIVSAVVDCDDVIANGGKIPSSLLPASMIAMGEAITGSSTVGDILIVGAGNVLAQASLGSGLTLNAGVLDSVLQRTGFIGIGTVAVWSSGTSLSGPSPKTVSGSKGSNAALASLITALAAWGLVTDSTS